MKVSSYESAYSRRHDGPSVLTCLAPIALGKTHRYRKKKSASANPFNKHVSPMQNFEGEDALRFLSMAWLHILFVAVDHHHKSVQTKRQVHSYFTIYRKMLFNIAIDKLKIKNVLHSDMIYLQRLFR